MKTSATAVQQMVNRYKSNGGNEYADEGELNYSETLFCHP